MKENVIDFLGNTPKRGSEAFNKALELYRKSKGNSPEQVRYMNTTGYSPERLEILKYELKKLHSITDLEVAKAKRRSPLAPKGGNKEVSKVIVLVNDIIAFNPEKATEEETAKVAETIRINLGIEENPIDGDEILVTDAEFVGAIRDYFLQRLALGEDPKKSFDHLVQITEESKKEVSDDSKKLLDEFELEIKKELEQHLSAPGDLVDENGKVIIPSGNQETSEATQSDTSETAVNTENEASEATSVEHKMTSEEIDEQAKGAAEAREKFLKEDLTEFDVEASKYNDIKSFAAELSDYINEDPKDQKGDTLKAFILEAKKKFPAN